MGRKNSRENTHTAGLKSCFAYATNLTVCNVSLEKNTREGKFFLYFEKQENYNAQFILKFSDSV